MAITGVTERMKLEAGDNNPEPINTTEAERMMKFFESVK